MRHLTSKELNLFFRSPMGYVILTVWLLAGSLMGWVFEGQYNLLGSGYATLSPLFALSPILLLLLAPAVTMRLFSEEKRMGTLEVLMTRPLSPSQIVLAKYFAACGILLIGLLPTLLSLYSLATLSPTGLDWGSVIGGYVALLCLITLFVAVGLFTSSLTSNQLISFLLSLLLCFTLFYGFEWVASLFSNGEIHSLWRSCGIKVHYDSLADGVIGSTDVIYFVALTIFFIWLTVRMIDRRKGRGTLIQGLLLVAVLTVVSIVSSDYHVRADLTEDQRFTLSPQTLSLVSKTEKPIEVILYLNGDLNPSFYRLRSATLDLLTQLAVYAPQGITLRNVDPALIADPKQREVAFALLEKRGMSALSVNERDQRGNLTSQVIYPWMEVICADDTIPIPLLRQRGNTSPMEQINRSIEELEYGFTDALRLLTQHSTGRIAYVEGHGETTDAYLHRVNELLSRYYSIDRGTISGNPDELSVYPLLIIASPRQPFTDVEKFALDQYVMQGGSVLWLLDGVWFSEEEFSATGESATMKLDVNLDDMLFSYGVRVNPSIVQDMNCTAIRVASTTPGAKDAYMTLPWYFAPLLEPSSEHAITKGLSPIKSEYVAPLSWVGAGDGLRKTTLLSSSANTHLLRVPESISLRYVEMPASNTYFNEPSEPVAGLIEGSFPSAFVNRLVPVGAQLPAVGRMERSKPTQMIVVGTGSILKNEWKGQGEHTYSLPLGYDQVMGEELGNADFLLNAVNYLTGNEQWVSLRSKKSQLHLLNRLKLQDELLFRQWLNTSFPLFLLLLIGVLTLLKRRR